MRSKAILLIVAISISIIESVGQTNKASVASRKPNILFIAVDDLRPELRCYGNPIIKTPNLDRLASRSLLFKNHFVQVPTCGASRFALLTGMRPKTRQHLQNDAIEKFIGGQPEGPRPESFIHYLKRNGYHTVGIGKISHSPDGLAYGYTEDPTGAPRELPHSWSELVFDSKHWKTGHNAFFGYADGSNRHSRNGDVKPYEKAEVEDHAYIDAHIADYAIGKLKELTTSNEPFFLGVGFFRPHLPFNAPAKYWDLYDEKEIPTSVTPGLPRNVNKLSLMNSEEFKRYEAGDEKPSLDNQLSDDYSRKLVHAYYASISYVDAQIGKVLQSLEDHGLLENTIVVVWGDHGWNLGDHRVWGKHTLTEQALNSVLMISVPNMKRPGRIEEQVVSAIDIYPSLMELCGLKMPMKTDGHSFAKLFSKSMRFDHPAYSYYRNGISMRTDRYRITKYFRDETPTIELYDHATDPHESVNVADDYPKIAAQLMKTLEKGDTGLYR